MENKVSLVQFRFENYRCGLKLCGNVKLANQGRMVRKFDLGDLEIGDLDLRTMEDIVQLATWRAAGMRGLSVAVGIY